MFSFQRFVFEIVHIFHTAQSKSYTMVNFSVSAQPWWHSHNITGTLSRLPWILCLQISQVKPMAANELEKLSGWPEQMQLMLLFYRFRMAGFRNQLLALYPPFHNVQGFFFFFWVAIQNKVIVAINMPFREQPFTQGLWPLSESEHHVFICHLLWRLGFV